MIDKKIKQKEAAKMLSLSLRQERRIAKKVKKHGDITVAHKNRGRESNRKFSNEFKDEVIKIAK